MSDHRLERLFVDGAGLFGRLISARGNVWHTLERTWRGNLPRVSCIRPGRYELVRRASKKLPGSDHVYALVGGDVGLEPGPGIARTLVEIHPANFPLELEGCIALGRSLNLAPFKLIPEGRRQTMLCTSRASCVEFFSELEAEPGPHWLEIVGGVDDGPVRSS